MGIPLILVGSWLDVFGVHPNLVSVRSLILNALRNLAVLDLMLDLKFGLFQVLLGLSFDLSYSTLFEKLAIIVILGPHHLLIIPEHASSLVLIPR